MDVIIDVVLREFKHGQDTRHEMNHAAVNVHTRSEIPDHVTDMRVKTGELQSMEGVVANQVGQEPAVNQVGKFE